MLKSFFLATILLIIIFLYPTKVSANIPVCPNRFVTFVNPVRGRNLWIDRNIVYLRNQYSALAKYNFPATWLLQYDALTDKEISDTLKSFPIKGEDGVFLEITKPLAENAGVVFHENLRWSDPGAVFLSAYTQSERKKLIDKLYSNFKNVFGYYPKAVGAWWIDSYSLNYIKGKYGLNAIMIVADQKTTDSYGVWGQWWGLPYYPSAANVLVPGNMDSVVIQWAQRDPFAAYGEGQVISNFSLQANDYIRSGKNTAYFASLVNKYLDCRNKLGQITIGMETGMEATAFQNEYENQLLYLSKTKNLNPITMSEFAEKFRQIYKTNPEMAFVDGWVMTPGYRENKNFGEKIIYPSQISFADYFVSDKNGFLDRNLILLKSKNVGNYFPIWVAFAFIAGIFLLASRKIYIFFWSAFVGALIYGLYFRSYLKYGWQVYFGPAVGNIEFIQLLLAALTISFGYGVFNKKFKIPSKFIWLFPLSFGLDFIISFFRFTKIDNSNFFGILLDGTHLIGTYWGQNIGFLSKDFSLGISNAFLKFPFEKIWANPIYFFIYYPLIHVVVTGGLYLLLKKAPKKIFIAIAVLLSAALFFQLLNILSADPRVAVPIT